ncbi:hypothetical protein NYV49_26225 [Escherichia coli]|nr:hypothetical protein [Escherichia coli]
MDARCAAWDLWKECLTQILIIPQIL